MMQQNIIYTTIDPWTAIKAATSFSICHWFTSAVVVVRYVPRGSIPVVAPQLCKEGIDASAECGVSRLIRQSTIPTSPIVKTP